MGVGRVFSYGGKTVWMLILGFVGAAIVSVMLLTRTAELRYQRDVNRMVYNDNLGVLNEIKSKLGMTGDSLKALLSESPAAAANPTPTPPQRPAARRNPPVHRCQHGGSPPVVQARQGSVVRSAGRDR